MLCVSALVVGGHAPARAQPQPSSVSTMVSRDAQERLTLRAIHVPDGLKIDGKLDTFYDRCNAVLFELTPIGGVWDSLVTNERSGAADWNPIWGRTSERFEGGWTAEMAVPFKSLRYKPGAAQTWGFNLRRTIRWKNEEAYLQKLPLGNSLGSGALFQVSNAATIVGIEAPSASNNIEVKPYALSNVTTDSCGASGPLQRPGRRRGRGRQVRCDAESHRSRRRPKRKG